MKKTVKCRIMCVLMAAVMMLCLMTGCEKRVIERITPTGTVAVSNDLVTDFYLNYEKGYSAKNFQPATDRFYPKELELTWKTEGKPEVCEVTLSRNSDLSDGTVYVTATNGITVSGLYVDTTYYWQVRANYSDRTVYSEIFSFRTEKTVRTVKIDGVTNSRDLGGKTNKNGKRIKQGMIYRSANLDGITASGKTMFCEVLGIKTDLDLRAPGEGTAGGEYSPAGKEVNYINCDAPLYKQISDLLYQDAFRDEIKVFANPDNYPVLFHCAVGRDRTGTLALVLDIILGLSEFDCYREYETSFCSRYGVDTPESLNSMLKNNFGATIDYLKNYGGCNDLEKGTMKYLKYIGVKDEEIQAIRDIMLENTDK